MPKKLDKRPDFDDLNHTELWQMAKRVGIRGAGPSVPAPALVHALDRMEHLDIADPTESHRTKLSLYLEQNIDRLRSQFQKDHCPNCHASMDVEFADCWLDNHHKVS